MIGKIVRWNAATGRVYSLDWGTNAANSSYTNFAKGIAVGVYTDTAHDADQSGFYRVNVQKP